MFCVFSVGHAAGLRHVAVFGCPKPPSRRSCVLSAQPRGKMYHDANRLCRANGRLTSGYWFQKGKILVFFCIFTQNVFKLHLRVASTAICVVNTVTASGSGNSTFLQRSTRIECLAAREKRRLWRGTTASLGHALKSAPGKSFIWLVLNVTTSTFSLQFPVWNTKAEWCQIMKTMFNHF